jgi:hypothetical protein
MRSSAESAVVTYVVLFVSFTPLCEAGSSLLFHQLLAAVSLPRLNSTDLSNIRKCDDVKVEGRTALH